MDKIAIRVTVGSYIRDHRAHPVACPVGNVGVALIAACYTLKA